MKRIFIVLLIILPIGFIISKCTTIDITNTDEVKEHLMEYTFEYVDYKANLTSFIQFYDNECRLTVFLGGKKATEKSYPYSMGSASSDRVEINIQDNSGDWSMKEDGDIYMYNKGELYIYHHKKL